MFQKIHVMWSDTPLWSCLKRFWCWVWRQKICLMMFINPTCVLFLFVHVVFFFIILISSWIGYLLQDGLGHFPLVENFQDFSRDLLLRAKNFLLKADLSLGLTRGKPVAKMFFWGCLKRQSVHLDFDQENIMWQSSTMFTTDLKSASSTSGYLHQGCWLENQLSFVGFSMNTNLRPGGSPKWPPLRQPGSEVVGYLGNPLGAYLSVDWQMLHLGPYPLNLGHDGNHDHVMESSWITYGYANWINSAGWDLFFRITNRSKKWAIGWFAHHVLPPGHPK